MISRRGFLRSIGMTGLILPFGRLVVPRRGVFQYVPVIHDNRPYYKIPALRKMFDDLVEKRKWAI